jgi:hypothetical protein
VPSKRWKCRFSVPKFKKISGSIPPDLPNLESVPLTFWDGLTLLIGGRYRLQVGYVKLG